MSWPHESPEVAAALQRFQALHPRVIDLGLGRVERVLAALGDPQHRLGASIHVAGTNGKGSVVAYLEAMGLAAGLSVQAYTSPHLVRFGERMRVGGRPLGDAALLEALEAVEAANAGEPLSFFEATTAAMFHAFARDPADLAIIEVGLGGRYDATNVFTPTVSVVTPVDIDHAEFLGRELAAIAREKAGVFKPGVPSVVGPQRARAQAVLEAEARRAGAPLRLWGRDFRAYAQAGRLVWEGADAMLDLDPPALFGAHQAVNAGTAVAAAPEASGATNFPERVRVFERNLIEEAMRAHGGHQGRSAEHLGLSYHQFRGLLKRHGLKR